MCWKGCRNIKWPRLKSYCHTAGNLNRIKNWYGIQRTLTEFWTFVGNKNNKQWLIYAYHRETGEIVAYVWGKRDLATVQRLKTKLKQLGIHYTRIASDHWDSFITAFKNCKQSIGKFFTVGIEGNNCKIRHRIRRGFRRSCNFSKKLENHFKAFDLTFFYINNGFI